MRNLSFILRSLAGAAALTAAGCQHHAPQAVRVTVPPMTSSVSVRPDMGMRAPVAVVMPPPIVETAPPSKIAEEVEPSPNELVKLARAAIDKGDVDEALRLARAAVLETPGRSAAWNTLGRVQLRRGERDAALESFAQAVETNPSNPWARNNHGLALLYTERFDEAIEELEQATDLTPSVGLMWNNLGMAYEKADRLDEARSAYRRAISLDHRGATQNFVRIEGVKTLGHTAQSDTPHLDDHIDEDLPMIDHGL